MKKNSKKDLDYKKVAIYVAVGLFIVATIVLIRQTLIANRKSSSEIMSLGTIQTSKFKEKKAVLTTYNDYKEFLKENDKIKDGNLKKIDFEKNNYLLLVESYAKDVEYAKKKINEVANSETIGLNVTIDSYNYCDDINNVELIAYLIPVDKESTTKSTKISVTYNDLNNSNCNAQ